jgi:uncharacterized protein (DUF58 family)
MGGDTPETGLARLLEPHILVRLGRLALTARTVVEGVISGLHRSPYRGFSMEFTSHRPYVPGDELRRIDWKAYGRLDRWFIKEFEEETNLKAYILVDASASMAYGRRQTKFRYASLLACSMAYLLIRQRDSVGLATFQDRILRLIPPRSTLNHLEVIARHLEGTEPSSGTDTAAAIGALAGNLKRRGFILVVSDLLDDPEHLLRSLKQLRHQKHDVIVLQVLDPDELELPFRRRTLFLDMESDVRIATDPEDVRQEYRVILGEYLDRIKGYCHANQVDYALFNTGEPLEQSLVRFLSRREGRT